MPDRVTAFSGPAKKTQQAPRTQSEISALLHPRIIFILLAITLVANASEGYYRSSACNRISERPLSEAIASSKKQGLIFPAIYKSKLESTAKIENTTILVGQSNLLTELIKIDIRHLYRNMQSNSFETGSFIENLIYANLRFQRLIDRYNELHEDAGYFQKTYFRPVTDNEPTHDDWKQETVSSLTAADFSRITSEYDSLNGQFGNAARLSKVRASRFAANPDPMGKPSLGTRQVKTSFQSFSPRRFNRSFRPKDTAEATEEPSSKDQTDDVKMETARDRLPAARTSELPWMIRFVVLTADYFVQNKIECCIYLGMFVFVVSLLFGGRK